MYTLGGQGGRLIGDGSFNVLANLQSPRVSLRVNGGIQRKKQTTLPLAGDFRTRIRPGNFHLRLESRTTAPRLGEQGRRKIQQLTREILCERGQKAGQRLLDGPEAHAGLRLSVEVSRMYP